MNACSFKGDGGQSDETDRREPYNYADKIPANNCQYTADIYGGPRGLKYNISLSQYADKSSGSFSIYEMHSNLKLRSDNIIANTEDVKIFCVDQFNIIENRPPQHAEKL